MEYFILPLIGGIVLYVIIKTIVRLPGTTLRNNFISLGILTGKTKAEIINIVGQPNAISSLPEGKILLQWLASGYHISLIFNGEFCEGVAQEVSV